LFALNTPTASDAQLKLLYRHFYEKFSITTYNFDQANYEKEIKITDDILNKFFAENKDKYKKPKTVSFNYAILNYQTFATEVNKKITEEDLQKYYDNNKELFVKNPTATKDKKEYKTFKTVKSEIRKRLIKESSNKAANNAATAFFTKLYMDTDIAQKKRLDIFAKMAQKNNLKVFNEKNVRSDAINYKGKAPKALFKAIEQTNIDTTYAVKAVEGTDENAGKFYVAIIDEKSPAQDVQKMTDLPKDIQNQIKQDYLIKESLRLAREDARKVYELISANKEIPKESKVVIKKLKPFNLMSASPSIDKNIMEISTLAIPISAGHFSDLNDNTRFGALFVKVDKRETPDMKEFVKQKPMMMMMDNSMRGNGFGQRRSSGEVLFGEWLNKNSSLYKQK